mmetsp:Transcript_26595/g.54932  ORF Transcript_26595/g.54932 Transcript_26595/m.54932 type:complete len:241 (+) Transcript_26595:1639-2361(+)
MVFLLKGVSGTLPNRLPNRLPETSAAVCCSCGCRAKRSAVDEEYECEDVGREGGRARTREDECDLPEGGRRNLVVVVVVVVAATSRCSPRRRPLPSGSAATAGIVLGTNPLVLLWRGDWCRCLRWPAPGTGILFSGGSSRCCLRGRFRNPIVRALHHLFTLFVQVFEEGGGFVDKKPVLVNNVFVVVDVHVAALAAAWFVQQGRSLFRPGRHFACCLHRHCPAPRASSFPATERVVVVPV